MSPSSGPHHFDPLSREPRAFLADTWAVVVARVGRGAKSRLSSILTPADRQQLALAMLADVVEVCSTAGLRGTVAVVDLDSARHVAHQRGAITIADPGQGDMNAAVAAGLGAAIERHAGTALVLPGDIPLISAADLRALVDAAGPAPRAVVVAASRDEQGTNALLLRPPNVIAPAFGPPSLARHIEAGLAASALTLVRSGLGLSLDVDTPADLAALQAAGLRGCTEAVLRALEL